MYSEGKYLELFKHSTLAIVLIEIDTGKFLEINNSFENIVLYKKNELKTFNFLNMFSITKEEIANSSQIEKSMFRKDGLKAHVKISFLLNECHIKNTVWIQIEDITKQKEFEIIYEDNKELLEYIAIENSLSKNLEKIVRLAERRNPEIRCSILLLDKSKKHLLSTMAPSLPDFYNEAINGVEIGEKVGSCGSAAYKKKRVIVENINTHENWQDYLTLTQKGDLNSCWSEPIFSSNNEILGTFAIYNNIPKAPSDFDIKLINSYANLASKAIEKYQYNLKEEESKQKLEELFNNTQVGLLYLAGDRTLKKANVKAAEIFRYETPNDMIGISMREFHINEENFKEFGKENFYSLVDKNNFDIEYVLKRKDGSTFWCELSGNALDTNRPADLSKGVLWTVKDITIRKEYEHRLIYSEILNKNILSAIPQLIWLKDKNGVYITCNEEFEKFFGAKEEQIIGKTDYDFVNKELADFFRMHDKNAMNSPSIVTNEELVTYATTGEKHLLETSKQALKDQYGNIIGTLGLGYDITHRKKREEELKALNKLTVELSDSQQILLSLFDKGDSILFNWNNDEVWSIEYVSLSVEHILGYSKEEFLNGTIDYISIIYEEDIQRVIEEVEFARKNKLYDFKHEPYRVIHKNGSLKWVLDFTRVKINKEGEVTNFIGYITDITEQRNTQEILFQQSKIASMGEMLGNISHQWRQPLSIVSTLATGTKLKKEFDTLCDKELLENMDSINENAQYLSKTIDDFRNFFSTSANVKKEIDLKFSINKTYSLIKDLLKDLNIETIINVNNSFIISNENMLIQAILNILNNAKDALVEKDIKNKYIFIDLKKDKNFYTLFIKDNAGGIESTIKEKIFEPYFTTKHQSQGTGIGLYMTNQIITKHLNGKIIARNETYIFKDKKYTGACFEIKLFI